MSIEAVVWAQDWAPIDDQVSVLVLNALARSADEHGRGSRPSKETIMWRTRLSESSVKRALRKLQKEGLIGPGDQSLAAHIPADRRPTVWDLDMTRRRAPRPVRDGRRGPVPDDDEGPQRPPVNATGGQTDLHGGSVGPDRGVTETGSGGLTDPQEVLREDQRETHREAAAGGSDDQSNGEEVSPDVQKILRGCGQRPDVNPDKDDWALAASEALTRGGHPIEIIGYVMEEIHPSKNGEPIRSVEAIRLHRLRKWPGKPPQEPAHVTWGSIRHEYPRTPAQADTDATDAYHAEVATWRQTAARERTETEERTRRLDDAMAELGPDTCRALALTQPGVINRRPTPAYERALVAAALAGLDWDLDAARAVAGRTT